MNVFHQILQKIEILQPINVFIEFAKQRKVNDDVIRTIQKRLFQKGITGDGIKLKTDSSGSGEVYAPFTIILKERDNLPDDVVTLFHTGEFYDRMVTQITKLNYIVDSDFQKDDGHMQRNFTQQFPSAEKFEQSVLSLTEQEKIDIIIEEYIKFYRQKINANFKV